MADGTDQLIALTADIVAAHVSHNRIRVTDLPELIQSVHGALATALAPTPEVASTKPVGAVSARASVKRDRLISMIDGKPYKTLARHLSRHGYTPDTYREAFDLPRDYPMVAADYAEKRRNLALERGLGRKRGDEASDAIIADRDDNPPAAPAPELPLEVEPAEAEQGTDVASGKPPRARRPRLKIRT